MSVYDNQIFNSDLDAYKNSGQVQTTSVTISGSLAAGTAFTTFSSILTLSANPDIAELLFDNSQLHSGKFKRIALEQETNILDTTSGIYFVVQLTAKIIDNTIQFRVDGLNTTATPLNFQSTTINFRYIPYEATF